MTSREYADVLVIGAGPAGIMTALGVPPDSGLSVLLLDAGHTYRQRRCPADEGGPCRGCGGTCNVISGFGGCIHYGDAVKVSRFPAGRRLLETLGAERAHQLGETAEGLILDHAPAFRRLAASLRGTETAGAFPGYRIKDYPVAVLTSDRVRGVLEGLCQRLASRPNVRMINEAEVVGIDPGPGGFSARIARTRPHRLVQRVNCRHLVVAVGRRGQRWWSQELRRLGVQHTPPTPSLGLRFECPTHLLAPAGALHPDFKASRTVHGVKVKTFCLCAGAGGGRVKFTHYGMQTLLDGHIIPEPGRPGVANIALLAQLRDPTGQPLDAASIDRDLLQPYRALRADRPGGPVLQWYPDFRARTLTHCSLREVTEATGFHPSVADYAVANLAMLLPHGIHRALTTVFEDLMFRLTGDELSDRHYLAHVAVMGLELEGLWDQVAVSTGMESSVPGLFTVGDCAGLAQGILQSAVAGLAAADEIIARQASPARLTSRAVP